MANLKRSAAKALSASPRFGAGATRNSGFLFGLNLSFDCAWRASCHAAYYGACSMPWPTLPSLLTCFVFFLLLRTSLGRHGLRRGARAGCG